MKILAELFQILKDDAIQVLCSVCQQIWKTQQWPQDWKRSVFIPIPKKGKVKECSNYHTIGAHFTCQCGYVKNSSSYTSAVREGRTFRCKNWVLKRQRNQRSNCQHSLDHRESKETQNNVYFCFIDYTKAFDCGGSQQTVENS